MPPGQEKGHHAIESRITTMIPGSRGISALAGIEGLVNPRGFVLVDEHQRNPVFSNVFGVGVCIAIPPIEKTAVAVGVPKTGYMIESMVTAAAQNIHALVDGRAPLHKATWNALCLADFGDEGLAFAALPQIPPRNVNWSAQGKWVHMAKVGFEKYFLHKVRHGHSEPGYEKFLLKLLGINRLQNEPKTVE